MTGKILIAHPLLSDTFFNQSVIYLTEHNQQGAFGFCLNFKTQFCLRDVKPQIKYGNVPIYEGGPVERNQLYFLHTLGDAIADSLYIGDNIYLGGNFEELLYHIEHQKIKANEFRLFAGYSGWTENQLEEEIEKNHWIVSDAATNFLAVNEKDLWAEEAGAIKVSYKLFADFGGVPSRN